MIPIEKKYNFIDFLIKFYFIDFLSKYNQKCHENERQLEKKGSVDDFDFQVFHLHLVTYEKTPRVYGATFILTLRRVQGRCEAATCHKVVQITYICLFPILCGRLKNRGIFLNFVEVDLSHRLWLPWKIFVGGSHRLRLPPTNIQRHQHVNSLQCISGLFQFS